MIASPPSSRSRAATTGILTAASSYSHPRSSKVLDYIEGDETVWEQEPRQALARAGQLEAFRHDGFWQPMDTLHEKKLLEALWESGQAEWKLW